MILDTVTADGHTIQLEREEERNARGRTVSATLCILLDDEVVWEGHDTEATAPEWQQVWQGLIAPTPKKPRAKRQKKRA